MALLNRTLKLIISLLIVTTNGAIAVWQNSPYFDTKFLVQYDAVAAQLKSDGFQEVYCTTSDNLKLHALYFEKLDASCNILCLAGWLPGRKETLAPFFSLFGERCNLLFLDARGHGKSQGPLLSNLWRYGIDDYKDIIGALEFLHHKNGKPIIIIGLCAGAFNAAHALINLQDRAQQLNVKGFVFDSGWASVQTASVSAPQAGAREILLKKFAALYALQDHTQAQSKIPFKLAHITSKTVLYILHTTIFKLSLKYHDKTTNLFDKIHHIKIPIFFIHAFDDEFTTIKDAQILSSKMPHSTCWWITEPSKHAGHHIKQTATYQEKIDSFIDYVLKS